MSEDIPAADGVGSLTVVLVCGTGPCASVAPETIDALRPVVQQTAYAILMRTGCLAQQGRCRGDEDRPGIGLQVCTASLQPRGLGVRVAATDLSSRVDEVSAWMADERSRPGLR